MASLIISQILTWEITIFLIFSIFLIVLENPVINYSDFIYNSGIQINNSRFILFLLCILSFFWAATCMNSFFQLNSSQRLFSIILILLLFLIIFFFSSETINLYVIFELSVLPIFAIIIGWGYQSERLNASLSLIFYTITASLPLLMAFLWIFNNRLSTKFIFLDFLISNNNSFLTKLLIFCFMAAFAVKLPMYGVHLWLPKAHVEAPVFGSIILAAILLKLGSYGIWIFSSYIFLDNVNIFISIRIWGGVIVSLICLRLTDLKIIIAYSSVRHIGIVLIPIIIRSSLSALGGIILILAHGVSSSAIFLISYYLYQRNFSRSLLLTKGLLVISRAISLMWFLIIIINIAAPPTLNLLSEILVISSMIYQNKINIVLLILIILIGSAYTLIIYRSSIQGTKTISVNIKLLNLTEILNIFNHLIWGFTLILRISLLNN